MPSTHDFGAESLVLSQLLAQAAKASSDVEAAIEIARLLLARAKQLQTSAERRQQAELDRMIGHPEDKATLVEMTDQAFRTHQAHRVADQLVHILDVQGVPRFFSGLDRTMLRGFQSFGEFMPGVAVPLVKEKMRRETANVILPAEREVLAGHLRARRDEGVRMNVNFLGESLIGEQDARERLQTYLAALRQEEVECISVKISTIYSQISPIGRRETIRILADRLELLYRAAARQQYLRRDGSECSKFVYLDMEEYRDMYLTRDAMMNALGRPGLEHVRAGIALQAYIPDSYRVLCELADWSRERTARSQQRGMPCQPLTIRVVKGANMEMERVEASLGGWPQAPYQHKWETDANYKRMVAEVLKDENAASLHLGVASHNLFDVALAMVWASKQGALGTSRVQFEMLEGMANHQRRAIFEVIDQLLLYAPACRQEDFIHAIGYLIRRLDENTGKENFLRYTFNLDPQSAAFAQLAEGFRHSAAAQQTVSDGPRRTQDRRRAPSESPAANDWREYINEPDTDWSLPHHAQWGQSIVDRWQARFGDRATVVPLVIAGEEILDDRPMTASEDPSRPGCIVCRYREADEEEVDRAVACAKEDPSRWRSMDFNTRHQILRAAAANLRAQRADLIGAAIADGGKTIAEADPEVSEAIDFTEFYALSAKELFSAPHVRAQGRGVVAVVSPWNFPIAIPCGGVAASLAAGNTVILKPASDTVLPASILCQCFWDAGVPLQALQLVPSRGSRGGKRLVSHPDVDVVILTGGTETAVRMLEQRPDLELIAETGGKNATIITALSDRELAIKHVLHSAFGHSGQKCSATSLLLLEEEVYEDPKFRAQLEDAVQSLRVGSAWDLSTKIGPLIRPPEGALLRGLKELEPGEQWLVMGEQVESNPSLYRPSVKWDVTPGSFTHLTELFGPVLGVMKFRKLEEAIELVHQTGYGLTSGLESLDDREQQQWQQRMRAGNLYINRPTTGAIVLRQPFGGLAKSAWGAGIKAGGPNYLIPLMSFQEERAVQPPPAVDHELLAPLLGQIDAQGLSTVLAQSSGRDPAEVMDRLRWGAYDFTRAARQEYLLTHDSVRLLGQDNLRRYRPVEHLRLRISAGDHADDILLAVMAAIAVGCRPVISFVHRECAAWIDTLEHLTSTWGAKIELVEEDQGRLAREVRRGNVQRIRLPGGAIAPSELMAACRDAFVPVIRTKVVASGRIEPLWYLNEQSLSMDYHRYGNLGRRAVESRRPVV